MKNQKPMIHLRVFQAHGNSPLVAYDEKGNVINKNQVVKIMHDTMEYYNFLKNLGYLGYIKVKVEKVTLPNDEGQWLDVVQGASKEDEKKYDTVKAKYQKEIDEALKPKPQPVKQKN